MIFDFRIYDLFPSELSECVFDGGWAGLGVRSAGGCSKAPQKVERSYREVSRVRIPWSDQKKGRGLTTQRPLTALPIEAINASPGKRKKKFFWAGPRGLAIITFYLYSKAEATILREAGEISVLFLVFENFAGVALPPPPPSPDPKNRSGYYIFPAEVLFLCICTILNGIGCRAFALCVYYIKKKKKKKKRFPKSQAEKARLAEKPAQPRPRLGSSSLLL